MEQTSFYTDASQRSRAIALKYEGGLSSGYVGGKTREVTVEDFAELEAEARKHFGQAQSDFLERKKKRERRKDWSRTAAIKREKYVQFRALKEPLPPIVAIGVVPELCSLCGKVAQETRPGLVRPVRFRHCAGRQFGSSTAA